MSCVVYLKQNHFSSERYYQFSRSRFIIYLATRIYNPPPTISLVHLRASPGQFLRLSFPSFVHLSNVELHLLFTYDVDPITFSHEVSSSRRGTDITIRLLAVHSQCDRHSIFTTMFPISSLGTVYFALSLLSSLSGLSSSAMNLRWDSYHV